MCSEEIGLHCLDLIDYFEFDNQHNWKGPGVHLKQSRLLISSLHQEKFEFQFLC